MILVQMIITGKNSAIFFFIYIQNPDTVQFVYRFFSSICSFQQFRTRKVSLQCDRTELTVTKHFAFHQTTQNRKRFAHGHAF